MKIFILALFCLITLTSCSRLSILARYADTLIWWEIDGMVDFSSDKRDLAKSEIKQMYQLASQKSLPAIADSIAKIHEQIAPGKKIEDLPCIVELHKVVISLPETLKPSAETFTRLLGPKEYQNLITNYRKKIEEDIAKIDKKKKKQIELYKNTIESFIGDLTDSQETLVTDFFATESYPFELQFENKKHNLQLVEATQGDPEKLKKLFGDFFMYDSPTEIMEFKNARRQYHEKTLALTNKIIISLTDKQKKDLKENSLQLAKDLKQLIIKN